MLNWQKLPSVTYGGKRYFYNLFVESHKWTVVWDRFDAKWCVQLDNKFLTHVIDVKAGKLYVESCIR